MSEAKTTVACDYGRVYLQVLLNLAKYARTCNKVRVYLDLGGKAS